VACCLSLAQHRWQSFPGPASWPISGWGQRLTEHDTGGYSYPHVGAPAPHGFVGPAWPRAPAGRTKDVKGSCGASAAELSTLIFCGCWHVGNSGCTVWRTPHQVCNAMRASAQHCVTLWHSMHVQSCAVTAMSQTCTAPAVPLWFTVRWQIAHFSLQERSSSTADALC
jgi:hypothetical protein